MELYQYIENEYPWQDANVRVAHLVIEKYKKFQSKNLQFFMEKKQKLIDEENKKTQQLIEEERLKKAKLLQE